MKMATWIEENKARASIKFICPHCGDQVYYAHGSNAQLEKSSNGLITKCCLYRVCPWCGEKVDPLKRTE